jgi:GNAT superfamily N-acetyltransferase
MVALKLFLYRARNRLFSRRAWVVLCRSLEPYTERGIPDGIEVREASESDIEAIAEALPDELAGRLSRERRIASVSERFRARVPCILAVESDSGQVVGGCWCRKVARGSMLWPLLPSQDVVFEISTLFVDPGYRGKHLGSVLVEYACSMMKGRGFNGCVSLVWYTRPASVKAHLKVGFKPVGEKVTLSFLGIRRSRVHPGFRQERLPLISKASS